MAVYRPKEDQGACFLDRERVEINKREKEREVWVYLRKPYDKRGLVQNTTNWSAWTLTAYRMLSAIALLFFSPLL